MVGGSCQVVPPTWVTEMENPRPSVVSSAADTDASGCVCWDCWGGWDGFAAELAEGCALASLDAGLSEETAALDSEETDDAIDLEDSELISETAEDEETEEAEPGSSSSCFSQADNETRSATANASHFKFQYILFVFCWKNKFAI